MKSIMRVLTTGFFALLPVLLIYLLIGQLLDMLMALTTPILDILVLEGFSANRRLTAALLLLLLIVLAGLAALTQFGRRFGSWLEETVLSRLPLYSMLRNLASRLSGDEGLTSFHPALVTTWPHMRAIAFVVEEHANGDYTIFMPIAPAPSLGYVHIMSREHVEILDVPARAALSAVLSWGDGAEAALAAAKGQGPESQPRSRNFDKPEETS